MIENFLSLPTFIMCAVAILIGAGISIVALLIIRKKLNWESFQENHEVGGFLFNALGLIYAVLIAFVVYATWEEYDSAKVYCENEANVLQDLFLDSEGLPESSQLPIKEKIIEYMRSVIDQDWPLLSIEEANPESRKILTELFGLYTGMDSLKTDKQKIYFAESLSKLNQIAEFRRLRILSSQSHVPAIIWTVIIIGSLTSIGFSLFFGTRSLAVQASMTSLFAMTNAIVILMILALDHPFTGDIGIDPDAFEQILNYLQDYLSK
ncbi:MAG: DUF4239 domain-containing protein [Ignavibacteria bacterium]|nr:DUF4239 domain-containing protein [Ignavibacteria bacterium]